MQTQDAKRPVKLAKTQESSRGDRPSKLTGYRDRRPVNPNPPKNRRSAPPQGSKL